MSAGTGCSLATRVGALDQRGDYTWFVFSDEYLDDPDRAVLGLVFEQDLTARYASHLRLPQWFSNLLPEGRLRNDRRGPARPVDREMELLAQVGHDLPGAVRVLPADEPPDGHGTRKSRAPTRTGGGPITTVTR